MIRRWRRLRSSRTDLVDIEKALSEWKVLSFLPSRAEKGDRVAVDEEVIIAVLKTY